MTLEEIYELHAMPAKSDLHPVSGYLEFRQGETNKSFIISAEMTMKRKEKNYSFLS